MIDQITAVRALKEAKMPEAQAEAVVQFISDATTGEIATKSDLRELGVRIGADIQEIKGELFWHRWLLGAVLAMQLGILALIANVLLKIAALKP